jgi:hypothetical protein
MRFARLITCWIFCFTLTTGICQPESSISALLKQGAEVSEHNPDSAFLLFNQALVLCTGRDSIYLPKTYNRLAQVYSMKGDYANAASYSFKALKKATMMNVRWR